MKPAHLRPQAEADLIEAARYYAREASLDLAERMFDAALAALEPIQRMPSMGSPRLGRLCDIPGLRSWRVRGFPMQWLYFEASDHLDVVRLLDSEPDCVPAHRVNTRSLHRRCVGRSRRDAPPSAHRS